MDPAWCTMCNGRDRREEQAAAERPHIFPAKFESHCPECNLPISIGQQVAWLPERPAVHESCWPTDCRLQR